MAENKIRHFVYPVSTEFIWWNIIDSISRFEVHYLHLTGMVYDKSGHKEKSKEDSGSAGRC